MQSTYNLRLRNMEEPMEADRINAIENSLQDLGMRAGELRRYL